MENQTRTPKKLWKPPSFDDFNVESPSKRIKLDPLPCKLNSEEKEAEEEEDEQLMLIDAHEPVSIEELATHPKKVEEVKRWLENSMSRRAPILLVTGPAGSAKTITVKVAAHNLNLTVREWVNPVDKVEFQNDTSLRTDPFDKFNFSESRQTDKFEEFMFRTSRYSSLFETKGRSIVLVEDFPNVFIWKPNTFHKFLDKYQAVGKAPAVFICTEDQNLNLADSLFPNRIRQELNLTNIKFNPVNHTSVMRILNRALDRHPDQARLSKETLEAISRESDGDIRSALSGLRLLLVGLKTTRKKVSKRKAGELPKLKPVAHKDCNVDFFSCLGRILYPKRIAGQSKQQPKVENKNSVFVHDVFEISERCGSSFLMLLHENYPQRMSCLTDLTEAAQQLSCSDALSPFSEDKDYAKLAATLGLMVANRQPTKGGFKPMKKSTFSTLQSDVLDQRTRFASLQLTCRVISLDLIPYLKLLPKWAHRLMSSDSTRLRTAQSQRLVAPQTSQRAAESVAEKLMEDEEIIIEEDED